MNLMDFCGEEGPEPKQKSDTWEGLRSRLSRYELTTKTFPLWDDFEERIVTQSVRFTGKAITEKGKEKFRVFREWVTEDLGEVVTDFVDFEKEDEAIDFMVGEYELRKLQAEDNMLCDGRRYFWSIKDGRPYRKYLGKFEGKWV